MKLREILLLCLLQVVAPPQVLGELEDQLRVIGASDGLAETACESVTLGGSDNVLVRHPNTSAISILDGYGVEIVPGPEGTRNRVYGSPGGQLWTVTGGGLKDWRDGRWWDHPVPEIARQQQLGVTNQIPLVPIRQGYVLVLLANRLLAFISDGTTGSRTKTLLEADGTGLAEFRDISASADGGLWLTGRSGYVRIPGPLRNIEPGSHWEEFDEMPKELVQRPRMLANVPKHLVLHSVDLTVSPDGTLWLAGPGGLVRYGQAIWKPAAVSFTRTNESGQQLALALDQVKPARDPGVAAKSWDAGLKARNGDVWLGGANEIAWRHKGNWRLFSSTNQIGPEEVLAFAESPDGRICCGTPNKVWEFDGRNWLALRVGFDRVTALHYSHNGGLWVGTHSGLYRWVRGAWVQNDIADGLASNAITGIQENDSGQIFAITPEGISEFIPDADQDTPRTLAHPLTEAELPVREGGAVRLSFAGRDKWDVTTPERLLFSYRLDDREWSSFEPQAEAVFVNLPVGRHYFQVRAMDRNANIDPQPARLEFAVVLPWYRETRLVAVLAFALCVAVFFAALALNRHHRLQLSYSNVERQVAERTRELELAQNELIQSQKMNALGTLAAGIAHDFNNILSIIKGSAQIIEENQGNPQKIRTRVDRIKSVVEQGSGIVTAMLGFSGSAGEQSSSCDLNSIVEDTIKLLGDRFLREVRVSFDPATDLSETATVRNFVQQILLNLIFNAAEAMTGNSHVTLRTRNLDKLPEGVLLLPKPAVSYVSISVSDTGCGIAPGILSRIFEPFFTTKALSTKRGTGLGLSMVYELAKKLEGGLAVESAVGRGSTFTLILPAQEGAT